MSSSLRCAVAAVSLLFGLSVRAQSADPLAGGSPFLPPSTQTESAPTSDAAIELRGIMAAGDDYMFSIFDSTKRMSVWKHLDEPGHEFVVRSYDPARDVVTVEYQGRTLTLALRTAKVAAAPVQSATIVSAPQGPQPVGGPVVLNPTPADEQRRLEAIAAEVNRRRMIRQQALQASRAAAGQPQPPPSQPPPNQRR